MKNSSISIGNYYEQFVQAQVSAGKFNNESEVIMAALSLLENEANKAFELKNEIIEGIESGIAIDFDPRRNLEELKANKPLEITRILHERMDIKLRINE